MIEVELSRIIIHDRCDGQVIYLKEKGGRRAFSIMVGSYEAMAIDRRLKNRAVPRPQTHDLLANVISDLGGKIERVNVNDLRDDTFFAQIMIRLGSELVEIDSRPSDAIALVAGMDVPIYVAEKVIDEVGAEE